MPSESPEKRIKIVKNGPYLVKGGVPLVLKTQVVSEYSEPLTWKTLGKIDPPGESYILCRCGKSGTMPFCDNTHKQTGFDGTETAPVSLTGERQEVIVGGYRVVVKKDMTLCMNAGFCGLRNRAFEELVAESEDTAVRSLVMAMVERCPAGALTYRIGPADPDIEPELPQMIADTVEITSDGPIAGPLWVMGGIPVERSDGQPFETRNRITLCNCGSSRNKPLCDGTHRCKAKELGRMKDGI